MKNNDAAFGTFELNGNIFQMEIIFCFWKIEKCVIPKMVRIGQKIIDFDLS